MGLNNDTNYRSIPISLIIAFLGLTCCPAFIFKELVCNYFLFTAKREEKYLSPNTFDKHNITFITLSKKLVLFLSYPSLDLFGFKFKLGIRVNALLYAKTHSKEL